MATQNTTAVTSSKQWIHFLRSDRWPPTSTNLGRTTERQSQSKGRRRKKCVAHASFVCVSVCFLTWIWDLRLRIRSQWYRLFWHVNAKCLAR
jgi:hypothetical protein